MDSIAWVLENRIAPLIDERAADGRLVRSQLKRFILLTEWWDSCEHSDRVHSNIPSRAWSFSHYLSDLLEHGITTYNRNFLQYQFRRLVPVSVLIRDRYEPGSRKRCVDSSLENPLADRGRLRGPYRRMAKSDWKAGSDALAHPSRWQPLNESWTLRAHAVWRLLSCSSLACQAR